VAFYVVRDEAQNVELSIGRFTHVRRVSL
jgi:hypothetical protein